MNKFIFFCIQIFCCIAFCAQSQAQSSNSKLTTRQQDSLKVDELNRLGKKLIDSNPDSTRILAEQSKKIAEGIEYYHGEFKSNNLIGNVLQRKGEVDSALFYYNIALDIAKRSNDTKGFAMVYNNIGIVQLNQGDYSAALESYFEALKFEEILNDTVGMAQAYNNIGIAHYYMSDLNNTLKYLKKSMLFTEAVGDLQVLKKGYINIGSIHQHLREYEQALAYFKEGYRISELLNDKNDLNIARHNMAQIHIVRREFEKAEEYITKSLSYQKETGNQKGIAIEYNYLGNLYREKGELEKAEAYYLKAIEICKKGGFLKDLEASYNDLSKLYSANKQYQKAFKSAQSYIVIKDSLLNAENSRVFAELRTKYETAEKEKELAEEKVKSESFAKEAVEAKLSTSNRNRWIIVLVALVIGVSLLFLIKRQQTKRKAQAEKDAAIIAEQEKGVNAVFEMQERERKRIAKDLHDGLGQQFAALKMTVNRVSKKVQPLDEEAGSDLRQMSKIIQNSSHELRAISHAMMPRVLTELGLIPALEGMLTSTLKYSGVDYKFEHYNSSVRLKEKVEIGIYRVAQELVNNIVKHSKATEVLFKILITGNVLKLIVEDNGIGINNSDFDGHGLLNIKSRVNSLGGKIDFILRLESGTKVVVNVPLANRL